MKPKIIKSYSELCQLSTFEERYRYLRLFGTVAGETFGFDRYLNQAFYKSKEWQHIRDFVIIRDNGCDLAFSGREIYERIIIHHLNPLTKEDVIQHTRKLLDPENLVCTIKQTHDAIHYGDKNLLMKNPVERKINDTCPWRH